jgi:hypothetical protein
MSSSKTASLRTRARRSHDYVCWTRMQSEAGQDLDQIIARKELERRAGKGLFAWGVGSPPSTLVPQLAGARAEVDIHFSRMRSPPKADDRSPRATYVWRTYFDPYGVECPLPPHLVITSRAHTAGGPKRNHYALLCFSERRLALTDLGPFDPDCFRNASGSGGRIGSSQVTCLLVQHRKCQETAPYRIAFSARLIGGLWVKLGDPLLLSSRQLSRLKSVTRRAADASTAEWLSCAELLRTGGARKRLNDERTGRLFEFV